MSVVIKHEQQQRRYVLVEGEFKELAQWVFKAVEDEGAQLQDFRPTYDGIFYTAQMNFPIRKD